MGYKTSVKNWEGLAKNDALWSILTDKSKKGDRWNTDDFFNSGESEVEAILTLLKNKNIELKRKATAIDFGCGAGRLTRALYPYFDRVIGIDASETMILLGRENNTDFSDKLEFKLNQSESLKGFNSYSISFALTLIVLQHIPFPHSLNFIKEMIRVLEEDGIFVFQVPVKDVRELSRWQKIKSTIRIRERLALIGIGSGFQMDMHVINEEVIEKAILEMKGEVVLKTYTNQTLPDYNGDLEFYDDEQAASGYVSRLFVVKKR